MRIYGDSIGGGLVMNSKKKIINRFFVALIGLIGLAWMSVWLGDVQKPPMNLSTPQSVGFSRQVVSSATEKTISLALTSTVPEPEDVYFQLLKNGDLMLVGTASLDGYGNHYALAADMTARFLQTAYRVSPIPVDYVSLYTTYHGHYIMAAGVGRNVENKVALATLGSDQGIQFMDQLARLDQSSGALSYQAFAEYQ